MRPNRGGKSVPPGRGGYEVDISEVKGELVYHIPVGPAKSRVALIPMGDGGENFTRPAPDPRSPKLWVPKDRVPEAIQQLIELYPLAERKALFVALLPAFGLGDVAKQIEAIVEVA